MRNACMDERGLSRAPGRLFVLLTIMTMLFAAMIPSLHDAPSGDGPGTGTYRVQPTGGSRGQGPGNSNWSLSANFTMGHYSGIDAGAYAKPDFGDLDDDGDLDMLVGESGGSVWYYNNTGSALTPVWASPVRLKAGGSNISAGAMSHPSLVDLDDDNDLDLVVGEAWGQMSYYRNTGNVSNATWSYIGKITSGGSPIDKGGYAAPCFADIDGDGDQDLTFGEWFTKKLYHYENTGNATSPTWVENTTMYQNVTLWNSSWNWAPDMGDVDNDGDIDLVVGEDWGWMFYFENVGDLQNPVWLNNTIFLSGVKVDEFAGPALADLDADGDLDITIGDYNGTLVLYDNEMIFEDRIRLYARLVNGEGGNGRTCFAENKAYTFRVTAHSSFGCGDIDVVKLVLDYPGQALEYRWDNDTRAFTEFADPNDYARIVSTTANAYNDTFRTWTLNFRIAFNWTYPDELPRAIQVYSNGYSALTAWLNLTARYQVENDLALTGDINVTGEVQGLLFSGDAVRSEENISWGGLRAVYQGTTDVYPEDDQFDVELTDDDGGLWTDTTSSGSNISINSTADLASDPSDTHIINITGVPAACFNLSVYFTIKVDADMVTFDSPTPHPQVWQVNATPACGIDITDIGGSEVNATSVEYKVSTDNGTSWSAWTGAGESVDAVTLTPGVNPQFKEGTQNLIRWRATDAVGNDVNQSDVMQIIVDPTPTGFSDPTPPVSQIFDTTSVQAGINVTDLTSGVNTSTVEYALSSDGGTIWFPWAAPDSLDQKGPAVHASVDLTLVNGSQNRIKWQAEDLAGNVNESAPHPITVDITLANTPPEVTLTAPEDLSYVGTTAPTLTWSGDDADGDTIHYYVFLSDSLSDVTSMAPTARVASSLLSESFELTEPLTDGKWYHWTVYPNDGFDGGSCLSGVWKFRVDIPKPVPNATLLFPNDASIIDVTTVELSWDVDYDGTESVTYDVYLDETDATTLVSEDQASTSYSAADLDEDMRYYWKVIPTAGLMTGNCTSGVWSFTVTMDDEAPVVSLLAPLDGSTLPPGAATLSWELTYAGDAAVTYNVILDTADPPVLATATGVTGTTFETADLKDGETYNWRIDILLDGSTTPFGSSVWSFSVSKDFVQEYGVSIELDPGTIEVALDEGDALVEVIITNTGNSPDYLRVSLGDTYLQDIILFEYEGMALDMTSGESLTLDLVLQPRPDTATPGVYGISLTVESLGDETGGTTDEATLTVTIGDPVGDGEDGDDDDGDDGDDQDGTDGGDGNVTDGDDGGPGTTPDKKGDEGKEGEGLSDGATIGIVVAIIVAVVIALIAMMFMKRRSGGVEDEPGVPGTVDGIMPTAGGPGGPQPAPMPGAPEPVPAPTPQHGVIAGDETPAVGGGGPGLSLEATTGRSPASVAGTGPKPPPGTGGAPASDPGASSEPTGGEMTGDADTGTNPFQV